MKEKIRVLQENNRIVIVIEDATESEIELVKAITGKVLTSVDGLVPTVPQDIPVHMDKTIGYANSLPMQNKSNHSDNAPFIMTKGRHRGKTYADIIRSDVGYLRWMADKNVSEFFWDEVYKNLSELRKKAESGKLTDLIQIAMLLDLRTDGEKIIPCVCEGLGIGELKEIKAEIDIDFLRNLLVDCLNEIGG